MSSAPVAPLLPEDDVAGLLRGNAELWEGLRGRRIFLTGGTGFFGRWLVGSIAAANERMALGIHLTVLTRGGEYFREMAAKVPGAAVRFHVGGVRSFTFPEGEWDLVIHAAAESTRPVPDSETRGTILDGTRRCLDFALERDVRRFLFVSSGSVYGRQPPALAKIPESYALDSEPEGLNAYGASKREAEGLVLGAAGPEVVIARCFAFVGPHLALDRHFAIGNFIRDALAGNPIVVQGDGTPLRSYLYSADLVVWLLTILLRGRPATAYNVGSEEAISIADLARLVADVVHAGTPVAIRGTPDGSPPARYVPSTARARSELGLGVCTPLPEAIRRTASWYSAPEAGA